VGCFNHAESRPLAPLNHRFRDRKNDKSDAMKGDQSIAKKGGTTAKAFVSRRARNAATTKKNSIIAEQENEKP